MRKTQGHLGTSLPHSESYAIIIQYVQSMYWINSAAQTTSLFHLAACAQLFKSILTHNVIIELVLIKGHTAKLLSFYINSCGDAKCV